MMCRYIVVYSPVLEYQIQNILAFLFDAIGDGVIFWQKRMMLPAIDRHQHSVFTVGADCW